MRGYDSSTSAPRRILRVQIVHFFEPFAETVERPEYVAFSSFRIAALEVGLLIIVEVIEQLTDGQSYVSSECVLSFHRVLLQTWLLIGGSGYARRDRPKNSHARARGSLAEGEQQVANWGPALARRGTLRLARHEVDDLGRRQGTARLTMHWRSRCVAVELTATANNCEMGRQRDSKSGIAFSLRFILWTTCRATF